MSDIEEPAAKISKLDHAADGEDMEDGQEEWLSEEILTDEEYNPAPDQEQSDSNPNTSREEGNDSMEVSQGSEQKGTAQENIEETLNNFENSASNDQNDLPKDLETFLVKKADGQQETKSKSENKEESDLDESVKQSDDDGNDTDDLLRMLGEDNIKKKENPSSSLMQANDNQHSSDDDDDYIFEGAKVTRLKVSKEVLRNSENPVKRLKVAKGAIIQKKIVTKAVPEDVSDKEADNHTSTKIKKFKSVQTLARNLASKAAPEEFSDLEEESVPRKVKSGPSKPATSSDEAMTMKRMFGVRPGSVVKAGQRGKPRSGNGINAVKTVTKRVVSIDKKPVPAIIKQESKPVVTLTRIKPRDVKAEVSQDDMDDDHLDEDSQDLDSDQEMEADRRRGQRLMRPERMDEEIPSDAETISDGDSYYDELPSSESDDMEDWFTLDLRTERAADYIPLLGSNAHTLLRAEQQRAAARLATLRQSARALCAGRRALASQLRLARASLAQLDAALTAH